MIQEKMKQMFPERTSIPTWAKRFTILRKNAEDKLKSKEIAYQLVWYAWEEAMTKTSSKDGYEAEARIFDAILSRQIDRHVERQNRLNRNSHVVVET